MIKYRIRQSGSSGKRDEKTLFHDRDYSTLSLGGEPLYQSIRVNIRERGVLGEGQQAFLRQSTLI